MSDFKEGLQEMFANIVVWSILVGGFAVMAAVFGLIAGLAFRLVVPR